MYIKKKKKELPKSKSEISPLSDKEEETVVSEKRKHL